MAAPPDDYDSPWKEALEQYLPAFLALLLPEVHQQIDWAHAPTFLDKELQAIARDAANGRVITDKLILVQLRRIQGRALQLLIHIEVQSGRSSPATLQHVGERMFRYFYRIVDRHLEVHRAREAELFSLCIFTAGTDGPSTLTYQRGYAGYGVQFSCPVIYLAKWLENWDGLERLAVTNPFAVIVMAQLRAHQAAYDNPERLASKTRIMSLLYQYRYSAKDVQQLMRLMDWMLILSAELEPLFNDAVDKIEQENNMAFVTSFERRGEQRGIVKGEAGLLQRQLTRKFGTLSETLQQRIETATPAQLETWSLNILDASTLDEVFTD